MRMRIKKINRFHCNMESPEWCEQFSVFVLCVWWRGIQRGIAADRISRRVFLSRFIPSGCSSFFSNEHFRWYLFKSCLEPMADDEVFSFVRSELVTEITESVLVVVGCCFSIFKRKMQTLFAAFSTSTKKKKKKKTIEVRPLAVGVCVYFLSTVRRMPERVSLLKFDTQTKSDNRSETIRRPLLIRKRFRCSFFSLPRLWLPMDSLADWEYTLLISDALFPAIYSDIISHTLTLPSVTCV